MNSQLSRRRVMTRYVIAFVMFALAWAVPARADDPYWEWDRCEYFQFTNGHIVDYWSYLTIFSDCIDAGVATDNDCWTEHGNSPDPEVQSCSMYSFAASHACLHDGC